MSRVAAIDCGTNTVRLLITEDGEPVQTGLRIVRLGAGVDASGSLAADAIVRAVDAIAEAATRAREADCEPIVCFATSAVRDAANRDDFVTAVQTAAGIPVEIISGETEAQLAFAGATGWLEPGAKIVCDIGGGSTELVHGSAEPVGWVSMQLGSVRITERHLAGDPPSVEALATAKQAVAQIVAEGVERLGEIPSGSAFVGVAGTVTTLAAIALGLETYDSDLVHGSVLPLATIEEMTRRLAAMSSADRLKNFPAIQPGREDVLVAGALILAACMKATDSEACIVSERDILHGMAALLAGRYPASDA
jgi:exopolyphosphatase / guanosine-5'-triphosphate,3'-diphosphate pyrophosphatase